MFALGILAALYAMLTRGGVKPWQAASQASRWPSIRVLLCVPHASYITLAPTAWLFLALYALQRASVTGALRRRWLVTSGVFYGLAIVGYFIYAFYLPAMLLALWLWSRNEQAGPNERWLRVWLPCWLGDSPWAEFSTRSATA